METLAEVDAGSSGGAVDLRLTSRDDVTCGDDVTPGRPLDLTLSGLTETEVKLSTPPDTPNSPVASAFKKTMLKRYSTHLGFFFNFDAW